MPGPRADVVSAARAVVRLDMQQPGLVRWNHGHELLEQCGGPIADRCGLNRTHRGKPLAGKSQVREAAASRHGEVGGQEQRQSWFDSCAREGAGQFRAQSGFGIFGAEEQMHRDSKRRVYPG